MNATPVRLVWVAMVLLCASASLGLLAGCGSGGGMHLPDVTTGVFLGPKPHQATINIRSRGTGAGIAGVVLTYPNGHKALRGQGVLEDGLGLGYGLEDLRPGTYTYTVYAVATPSVPESPILPSGARVDENIISSGTFVID